MPKFDLDLSDAVISEEQQKSENTKSDSLKKEDRAKALPSPFRDEWREKLRHKEQFGFGRIPVSIIDDFNNEAKKLGMGKLEYLYHLMRQAGHDIPPYQMMDRRKL